LANETISSLFLVKIKSEAAKEYCKKNGLKFKLISPNIIKKEIIKSKIEDGEIDHAEGSKIFSEIGLAFYKSKPSNDDTTIDEPPQELQQKKEKSISWSEYKKTILQK
jgi:hypothetical protein